MYNIYVSGTFVVCHSVAYPRCHLQDSLVYHIPTGKVYHFAELTVEMASLSILFDRLLLTHQKGTITCAEIFSLPNDEDSVLLQNTHCGVLNLPPSRYRSLDHLSAFSLGNGRFVFTALNHEPDLVHHNPCVIEVNFHDDGNITSHVIAETEGSSVFKTCTNVSSRQQTTQLRIVSFAFEDEAPLVLSDLRFHQQADEHQSVDYWRDCQMPLPKSEQYPFDYVFDGYVGRICLCYAGVGVVIGDFA
ncbi:hypothetical protein K435DRAFT_773156 [Dendrothele bispora CBS 962.96]|uniref:Uncharacterized protein n=1 Tax=Dendrothele bispora (strain CBS 962.96) TaxID=1314807 RepID=A0A4S8MTR1_DENBC|nr:hypothetical protein K435DRAFT_773156 [Dendrothele bispora CBS 962.96]